MEKHDSKEALITAAKKVFARRGYDGATVKEIADAAGVNVSLVSYYFSGKEGLFRACVEEFGKSRLAATERILREPESAEDFKVRLELYSEEVISCHVEEKDITTILHRDCLSGLECTKDIFRNSFIRISEILEQFLSVAQQRGILRADLDIHITTLLYWGSIIHTCRTDDLHQEYFGKSIAEPEYRKKIVQQVVKTFLHGVLRGHA